MGLLQLTPHGLDAKLPRSRLHSACCRVSLEMTNSRVRTWQSAVLCNLVFSCLQPDSRMQRLMTRLTAQATGQCVGTQKRTLQQLCCFGWTGGLAANAAGPSGDTASRKCGGVLPWAPGRGCHSSTAWSDKIELKGLTFFGHHGVLPEVRKPS